MTNPKETFKIIEVKVHVRNHAAYRYQQPVTVKYYYNNKIIADRSLTGINSFDGIYIPPGFFDI